jgi:hypothetical protein
MATIALQRLPSANPPLLYEPYRGSAAWIQTIPECRGATVPVLATDPERYYKPGVARTLVDYSYASALEGYASPRTVFLEEVQAAGFPADLRGELRSHLAPGACPVLLWSVHNMTPKALAFAQFALAVELGSVDAGAIVKSREFRDGQVGYVLYLERPQRPLR